MNDMQSTVISSRIRLARNISGFPFRMKMNRAQADECIDQVLNALKQTPVNYRYFPMRGMTKIEREKMLESHLISEDLYKNDDSGVALFKDDNSVVIMVNEEDHLRIQGFSQGLSLERAAQYAFEADDILQRQITFSFDDEWGYLTACPTNTGTGMRASVMLHLPMLTYTKKMGTLTQSVSKTGLTLRGIYGEGSQALGNVYQLSNQITLGRTEEEIIETVNTFAEQLESMEMNERLKALDQDPLQIEDQIARSIAIIKYARKMSMKEFYIHWSNLRMSASMGKTDLSVTVCDRLLEQAQKAHLLAENHVENLTDKETDVLRSDMLREFAVQYGI